MKFNLVKAIRNVIKNSKKEKKFTSDGFASSKVQVPPNNLELGQLKLVSNTRDKNKVKLVDSTTQTNTSKTFDKDKFMYDIMRWSKELDMSDKEYEAYQKRKSLSDKMELSNIKVFK